MLIWSLGPLVGSSMAFPCSVEVSAGCEVPISLLRVFISLHIPAVALPSTSEFRAV